MVSKISNHSTFDFRDDEKHQLLVPIVNHIMGQGFPEILPGGSLILAWQIKDRHVLVVGGGEVREFDTPPPTIP